MDKANQSSVAGLSTNEQLVRLSTSIYVNHAVTTSQPDLDRFGSNQATPSDNVGGGLGNWHDAGLGNLGVGE